MTALVTPRLGKNSCAYRNTASYGTPTWVLIKNIKDLKAPNSFGEDDVSARITGGFEAAVTTLQKVGVSFGMFDDDGTDITAIRTAYYAQTPLDIVILNGLITDAAARGVRGTFQVKKFDESQGNDKAVTHDVDLGLTWPDPTASASAVPFSGTGT